MNTMETFAAVNKISNRIVTAYENMKHDRSYGLNELVAYLREEPQLADIENLGLKVDEFTEEWNNQAPETSKYLLRSQWVAVKLYDLSNHTN